MKVKAVIFAWFLLVFVCPNRSEAQSAVVYWNNVDQQIDGFGASNNGAHFTEPQAEFFFSTGTGDLGLSLLRTEVPNDGSCVTVNATCAGGVLEMQRAIAQGARIWSTPWSPPASMKSNGSTICNTGSGTSTLNAGSYPAYAAYLVNYVKSLKNLYGIRLQALSVQNEPSDCSSLSDGAIWSPAQLQTFVKANLGPEFAAQALTATPIMMPESSGYKNLARIAGPTMGDPAAAAYVGILAFHDYDQAATTPYPFPAQGSTKYWESEVSGAIGFGPSLCGGCWDPSIADAIMWAQIINNRLTVGNINAWHYWLLIGGTTNNEGLIGPEGATIPKRAYMVGNYSKFVRPGFYRIDATPAPQAGIEISAFKNASDGTLVIVAINANTESVTQSFTLNGLTVGSVTPWITSAGLNLAEQSEFEINGSSFTFKLPGSSVTTFVSTSTLAAPTNLTTTVH